MKHTTTTPSGEPARIYMVFLGLLAAIAPLATDMYIPALPELMDMFRSSPSVTQLTITSFIAGMAIGQFITGPISDDQGRKKPLFLGMALCMVSSLACVFVPSIEWFIALRFVQGFTGSIGVVIARAIARDICHGPALTRFFSFLMFINGLSPILAPVVGGQLLRFWDWRSIFVCLFGVSLALTIGTVIMKETLPPEKRLSGGLKSMFLSFFTLWRDSYFMGHCALQCFAFAAFFSYISGGAFIFQHMFHLSPQEFSYVFGLTGISLLVTIVVVGKLTGTVEDWKILRFSLVQAFVGSVVLFFAFWWNGPMWFVIVCIIVTLSTIASVSTSSFSLAMNAQGNRAGGASALIGFFSTISGAIMAPLVGIMGDQTAMPMAIIIVSGETGAILCYYMFIRRHHQ